MERGPQGAGFLFGAQSGVSTGEEGVGISHHPPQKAQKEGAIEGAEPSGAWCLRRARGSC